jgi:acetyl-CoA C-acetyltransferase
MGMSVPEILSAPSQRPARRSKSNPRALDVGSVGAVCNISLNQQGLLAGLVADIPGLAGKPIESVENACASGGQAVLSVIQKLQIGWGDIGIAIGYEKMRDAEGKMDGKLIGQALGYFLIPTNAKARYIIFPHLFAEVMECYLKVHGVAEEHLAQIAVAEYANARHNPYAQMRNVDHGRAGNADRRHQSLHRRGLPLKTYDCSQITDGYAALILATEEGLTKLGVDKARLRRDCRLRAGNRPSEEGGPRCASPRGRDQGNGQGLRHGGCQAGRCKVAEIHDCFTVMGALGVEVLGKAEYGKGAQYWVDGKAGWMASVASTPLAD